MNALAAAVILQQLTCSTAFTSDLRISRAVPAGLAARRSDDLNLPGRWVSRIQRRQTPQRVDLHENLATKSVVKNVLHSAMTVGSLAFLAGAVDAVVYTKYRCYTNMMTGNSIVAGQALAVASWGKFGFVASMLVNYVIGVAVFRLANLRFGARKFAATAPLVFLAHLAADAVSWQSETQWHLLLLAFGAGLANAFSANGPEVVTNMLTGHWNSLANFLVDLISGRPVDAKRQGAAMRSLGIALALLLGVAAVQRLLQMGISPRFWWFGAAYAAIFAWHDLGKLRSTVASTQTLVAQGTK